MGPFPSEQTLTRDFLVHGVCEGPNLGIDWQAAALGHNKNRRKTIGFGDYNKKRDSWSGGVLHIREVSLMSGGFGAAVWDAAIIMARWIYMNPQVFEGKYVHELGCGVGLPGLIAARFCDKLVFSDYLPGVLENVQHNIDINTNLEFDEESDDEERECSRKRKEKVKSTVSVVDLNWDDVSDTSSGSSCDIELADIIIGSELTYSPKSVDGLIKTVEKYLKPDGIFYEILSTDRDGVPLFVELIEKSGWSVTVSPVPEVILSGKFNTKQRPESYRLFTFRRPETSPMYPDFA